MVYEDPDLLVLQNAFIRQQHFFQQAFGLRKIRPVGDIHLQVQLPFFVGSEIGQAVVGQDPVGDDDGLVIHRAQLGVEDLDLLYRSFILVGVLYDIVSHLEGLQHQDQHPACEVGQAPLEGKAQGHAAGSHRRRHCGCVQPEVSGDGE